MSKANTTVDDAKKEMKEKLLQETKRQENLKRKEE